MRGFVVAPLLLCLAVTMFVIAAFVVQASTGAVGMYIQICVFRRVELFLLLLLNFRCSDSGKKATFLNCGYLCANSIRKKMLFNFSRRRRRQPVSPSWPVCPVSRRREHFYKWVRCDCRRSLRDYFSIRSRNRHFCAEIIKKTDQVYHSRHC